MKRLIHLLALGTGVAALGATVPEPSTVLYGRIVNRTSGPEYLVTSGTLEWTIDSGKPGTTPHHFAARLQPLGGGQYSYKLKIPHAIADQPLDGAVNVVPLGNHTQRFRHVNVRVDGKPARLSVASGGFDFQQAARASTYRVDLEVFNPLPDSDGDGLPDGWEDHYGSNKRLTDSQVRPGGGLTYAESFRWGLDPREDHRIPRLVTRRIRVMEGGTSQVTLRCVDVDSSPGQLTYTVARLPDSASLWLRGPSLAETRALGVGETFTQADVDAGRLHYRQEAIANTEVGFSLVVKDENPAHAADVSELIADVFRPDRLSGVTLDLWLDAADLAKVGGNRWPDRSGSRRDAVSSAGGAPQWVAGPVQGTRAVAFAGLAWDLASSGGVWGAGDTTLFGVFKASSEGRQQVVSTPALELGVDAVAGGQLGTIRFASGSSVTLGRTLAAGAWGRATAIRNEGRQWVERDGVWEGDQIAVDAASSASTHPTLGARTLGRYERDGQGWVLDRSEALQGAVAEVVAYAGALSGGDRLRVDAYLASKWFGAVVSDHTGSTLPIEVKAAGAELSVIERIALGVEPSHILFGGSAGDLLGGSNGADVLVGGPGSDRLTGGAGADRFVYLGTGDGEDTITDFSMEDGDVIDLSNVLDGASTELVDYVRIQFLGTKAVLEVDAKGLAGEYGDLRITLENIALRPDDLDRLWSGGHLVTGGLLHESTADRGPTIVEITATKPTAGEDTEAKGEFVLTRTGSKTAQLNVPLNIGGTALNGVDYAYVPMRAQFAPGQASVRITLDPYLDALVEPMEVVEISVLAGSAYEVGAASQARVTIADLPERFGVGLVEATASQKDLTPATFRIQRTGMTERMTVVSVRWSGTSVNGVDYQRLAGTVTFNPGQAVALISVQPKAGRPQLIEPKTIELTLLPDPAGQYVLSTPAAMTASLVAETIDFGRWRAERLPEAKGTNAELAAEDSDGDRISNLIEYAFGLDPRQMEPEGVVMSALPHARVREGHMTVEFQRPVAIFDVAYVVETSGDLTTWSADSGQFERVDLPENAGQPERVCLRDRNPIAMMNQRYVRVRVKLP